MSCAVSQKKSSQAAMNLHDSNADITDVQFNVDSGDANQDQKENKWDDTEVIPPQHVISDF